MTNSYIDMSEIIPAIIPKNFEDLEEKTSGVRGLAPLLQTDVLDGSLAPVRSWPYQSPTKRDIFFDKIISEQEGFPFWRELEFEAHLMVREPERIINDWVAAGAARIIVQIEGVSDFKRVREAAAGRVPLGVAITLDTPREKLTNIAVDIEVIQLMGWKFKELGHQGRPFDAATVDAVGELRRAYPRYIISVDGGVNLENAPALLRAGADRLVVGSAIFGSANPREAFQEFNRLTKSL